MRITPTAAPAQGSDAARAEAARSARIVDADNPSAIAAYERLGVSKRLFAGAQIPPR
jgi:hypothetical protein